MPQRRHYRCEDCGQPFTSGYYRKPGHRTCTGCAGRRLDVVNTVQRSPEFRELLRQVAQRKLTEAS